MRTFRILLAGALAAVGISIIVSPPAAFAAASVGTFDQCQRGTPNTVCSGWTGGNLINGYNEDQVVPQRVQLQVDSAGSYSFTTSYDMYSGASHQVDFLATYNYTVTGANPCQSPFSPSWCTGPISTFNIPSDTLNSGAPGAPGYNDLVSSHELPQADRKWTMYGGTITGSTITHNGDQGVATITFTTTGPVTAVLLFGAHLALTGPSSNPRAWSAGASTVNGNAQLEASIGGAKTHNIKTGPGATPPPPPAAYTIAKTATPTTAGPGDPVTYKVTVTNTGGSAGTATFTDDYDSGLTSVTTPSGCSQNPVSSMTCTTDLLAAGASQTFTYTANLPTTFVGAVGTGCLPGLFAVTNVATFALGTNLTAGTGPASATVCVTANANFSVTKTPRTLTAAAGGNVTYDVVVTNNGSASGATSFTDNYNDNATAATPLPSGCTDSTAGTDKKFTCTTGTINPGSSQTFTYVITMPATFTGSPIGCTNGGYPVVNNVTGAAGTASATVCVTASPSFTIKKTPRTTTAAAGGNVIYDVEVKNTGTAPGSTSFTDNYDDNATAVTPLADGCVDSTSGSDKKFACTTGSINPGSSQTFTYTITMPTSFTGAPAGCQNGGYPVVNNVAIGTSASDTSTVCVTAAPTFSVTKTPRTSTATAGGNVIYDVVVSNTGSGPGATSFTDNYNDNATAVTPLPAGCVDSTSGSDKKFTCTTAVINPGASKTFTYTITMPASFTGSPIGCTNGGYPVVNQVTGAAGSASATVCVTASPTFSVVKTPRTTTATAGSNVVYDVVVSNTGSGPGTTTFTDNYDDAASVVGALPSGCSDSTSGSDRKFTCTTGVINPGQSQTLTYTIKMPASFSGTPGTGCTNGSYPVLNQVSGAAGSASGTVCVSTTPSFSVTKTPRTSTAAAGGNVVYDVVVSNNGTGPGTTSFTDNYDDAASTVTLPGTCTDSTVGTDKKFTCTTGTINPGTSQTITYTIKMPPSFTGTPSIGCTNGGYAVVNQVTGAAGTASSTVCVTASPSFSITKNPSSQTAAAGGTITYTVTVTNNGTGPGATSFTDNYDDTATAVTPLADGCVDATSSSDKKFTCTTQTINPGQSQVFTYDIRMPSTFTGTPSGCSNGRFPVANSVAIGTSASSSATVCVDASPTFTVKKTPRTTTAAAGGNVIFDVLVTNNGSAPGTTSFTDDYNDAASTVTLPSGCSDSTVGSNKKFTCTTGTINPGQSVTITYTLKMPASFTGNPTGCENGGFPVVNSVAITGSSSDSATVCVTASPHFTIVKTVAKTDPNNTVLEAGESITYTITVTNDGTASGGTSFTDDYDNNLTGIALPTGCALGTGSNAGTFSCDSGTLAPLGGQKTFTVTANVPTSFTGTPDCGAGTGYTVANSATLIGVGGATSNASTCVTAAPSFTILKTVAPTSGTLPVKAGDSITYTIVVTNNGTAAGSTSFVDDYDDNLTGIVLPNGCTAGTGPSAGTFSCSTGTLAPLGGQKTFTVTAKVPATFNGAPNCGDGTGYRVANSATLVGVNAPSSNADLCVPAAPVFAITKTVANTDPNNGVLEPGESITYTITVSNNGTAPGATSFTDDYDDSLTDVSLPSGCTPGAGQSAGTFSCTTGTIQAGSSRTFTVTAKVPTTFTGAPTCPLLPAYRITNSATLTNGGATASANTCVFAAPTMTITKSGTVEFTNSGDQVITFTIGYANTGAAEATAVTITDQIPAGTAFVSCSGGCTTAGSPLTATWSVPNVAPLTGTGSVQLKVRVTTNQACSITNTAQIKLGGVTAATSAPAVVNVTPVPDPATAKSNGNAIGVQVKAKGVGQLVVGLANAILTGSGNNQTLLIGQAASSQAGLGGPTSNAASLLTLNLTGIISTGVIRETSSSVVTAAPAETRQTSTSEVAGVCLVPVAGVCTVKSDTVRAVASTMANGSYSGYSAAGSTIENLYVAGIAIPVDLSQTTKIPLNALLFGKDSYVAINERTGSSGLASNGKYTADLTVSMIHVKITNLALVGALDVVVAQATSHSEFGKTLVCSGGTHQQSVSGHAYNAKLYTGPLLADLLLGYVQIAPLGGAETEHVAGAVIPSTGVAVNAQVADSSSSGGFDSTSSTSRSWSELAGDGTKPLCVLSYVTDCVLKASLVRSEARSTATSGGSISTDTGTQFLGLRVFGIPIAGTPDPNTTIVLPGIGFIILNEQFCDNGAGANHTCAGPGHTGITVRAARVVVTVANNILNLAPGIELILSEAHADTTYN